MSKNYYYDQCKTCDYLYQCFGRDIGEKIENEDVNNMYLHPSSCNDYYPERKQ